MTRTAQINDILRSWRHEPSAHKAISTAIAITARDMAEDLTAVYKAELAAKTANLTAIISMQHQLIQLLVSHRES